ncbi:NAD(P)H-quinone oxidoreductase [Paucibacter sp. PLA-PC-4]|uniref:NAD(P)H-quinone oxidoreductase n=1 Tax=Paucibacter sp. PLA-PC-4 TaxID=2993655 RepID=UPI002248CFD4|nr:NAD(P)H-quinone oxidoreductase [Paucibacter sp. PLA-PC-4]MCX2861835.1 NAD(P)H-quinone oxidoreductase [Paucibacter sp. PLA-PC-4]
MKAIAITRPGGPEVLRLIERPDPVAGLGELLVAVEAYGINRPDVLQRKGAYPPPAGASDLPGLEVAGRIVGGDAAELAAAGFKLGDAVCALVAGGGYAQLCVAPIAQCLPVPAGWSMAEAAGLPETFFTVWSNVFERARLQPGESLLVHGGSSGIGVTAIQIAKALGSRVLVTVGTADKADACLKLGADVAINYKTQDFVAEVKAATEGRGVDVILDMVAGGYVERGVQCLADDGRMVIIAVQGGLDAKFDAGAVLRRRLTISGSTLRPRSLAFKAQIARALHLRVWPLLASRAIAPVIYRTFAADQAAAAHALMESGEHVGKIVLSW